MAIAQHKEAIGRRLGSDVEKENGSAEMMTPYPSTVGERKDELFAVGKHCLNSLHFLACETLLA